MKLFRILVLYIISLCSLSAQKKDEGVVTGHIVDRASSLPVGEVPVVVKNQSTGKEVSSGATNSRGEFSIGNIPNGHYELSCKLVGAEQAETRIFTIDTQHRAVNLDRLILDAGEAVKMEKIEVRTDKEAFSNSIDRKVYNVGKDIQSVTGTASDLLQNVPSVQVDIEGNVSLRGDANVLILVNGKTSSMMGKNRAAVLDQMPADGIEKIEVITNPSAKYKPDGTGGIINITLKKKTALGYSGSVRAAVGNNGRYNASISANYNPGKYNLYGSGSVRQDDRPRSVHDMRSHPDSTGAIVSTTQVTSERSRPLSRIAQAGIDYQVDDQTKIGGAVSYNYRDFLRRATVSNLTTVGGAVTQDFDRLRADPEYEKDLEFTGTLQHTFLTEDRELNLELRHGRTTEQEDNHYTNLYHTSTPSTFDNALNKSTETNTEGTAEYIHPVGADSKWEVGYNGQSNEVDMDFRGSFLDLITQTWQVDTLRSNRFIYEADIQAVYTTFAQKFGRFGVLAGLRFEQATIHTNQITSHLRDQTDYNRLYPSLHLSYNLTDVHQLQLNYSHRVHRPEGDDLNPFPKYDDPTNLRVGNPRLRPEEIHSVEAGYQYKNNDTTYLATAYYRYRYNSMTEVRRFVDATTLLPSSDGTVLLTTKENLGFTTSSGLEIGAITRIYDRLSLNLSSNIYRSEIDANTLGFSSTRATIAFDAKLNTSFELSKRTILQLNTNYIAKRLTPQGYRYPTYVVNVGLRHNFADKKTAFILSVADVLNSLKERTLVDTPKLHEDSTRRRSARIFYAGFSYAIGKPSKKAKEELQFDNSL